MAGTKMGGLKAAETNRKKHGDDFYATGGFASMTHKECSLCGRKGGLKSTRRGIKNGQGLSRQSILKYAREAE